MSQSLLPKSNLEAASPVIHHRLHYGNLAVTIPTQALLIPLSIIRLPYLSYIIPQHIVLQLRSVPVARIGGHILIRRIAKEGHGGRYNAGRFLPAGELNLYVPRRYPLLGQFIQQGHQGNWSELRNLQS